MPDAAPPATVSRLITYLRTVSDLLEQGVSNTSSEALAGATHISAFQIRKDLAYFGTFGTRGSGYDVQVVHDRLREILGLTAVYNVALIGMERLGQAITHCPPYGEYGFRTRALLAHDPARNSQAFVPVAEYTLAHMARVSRERDIELALITVPVHDE